jgi:urea transport system permease protein
MRFFFIVLAMAALALTGVAHAQGEAAAIIAENRAMVEKPSRQTIGPVIAALAASGDPAASTILEAWGDKRLGLRKADGVFFVLAPDGDGWALTDLAGNAAGTAPKADITEMKPNAGVRGLIATALVRFTLSDPDRARREAALTSIARDPNADHLEPLRASIEGETDPVLKTRKTRLERLLTLQYDPDPVARVAAINGFGADLGLDVRGAFNPILATTRVAAAGDLPDGSNIAGVLKPGRDLTDAEAYELLVAANLAPARLTPILRSRLQGRSRSPPPMTRPQPPLPPTASMTSTPNPMPP